jgi:hypothetical protein
MKVHDPARERALRSAPSPEAFISVMALILRFLFPR